MSYRPFSSTNVDLIKRPHLKVKLTAKQVQEIARCMISPNYFIRQFCQVQHPIKGRVPFKLYDYQERLVATYHEHRHSIALMPRQSGKSSCAAGYLLWYATYVPDSTILITAHKQDGSLEIMSRIRFMYETLPDFIRSGVVSYGRKSIEFDNGSRIIAQATTENTGRGLPVSLLYADEFAFVPPRIAEEFWSSIMPTLSTGGRCIVTSTPNRDDDQFATIWHQANKTTDAYGNETLLGSNGFKAFQAHWSEHPDRGEKWAAAERAKIGEERFRREFETEFITFDETLINSLFLAGMERGDNPCRRSGQVRWYGPLENGPTYLVSLDPSLEQVVIFRQFKCLHFPECNNWLNGNTTRQSFKIKSSYSKT